MAQRPAAFADDYRRASILVASIVSPSPKAVVDFFAARREGTHALYIEDDGRIRVETVARTRGQRPWSSASVIRPVAKATARGPPSDEGEPVDAEPGQSGPPDPPQ